MGDKTYRQMKEIIENMKPRSMCPSRQSSHLNIAYLVVSCWMSQGILKAKWVVIDGRLSNFSCSSSVKTVISRGNCWSLVVREQWATLILMQFRVEWFWWSNGIWWLLRMMMLSNDGWAGRKGAEGRIIWMPNGPLKALRSLFLHHLPSRDASHPSVVS